MYISICICICNMYMTLGKTLVRVIRYLFDHKKVPKTVPFLTKKVLFSDLFDPKRYLKDNLFCVKQKPLKTVLSKLFCKRLSAAEEVPFFTRKFDFFLENWIQILLCFWKCRKTSIKVDDLIFTDFQLFHKSILRCQYLNKNLLFGKYIVPSTMIYFGVYLF